MAGFFQRPLQKAAHIVVIFSQKDFSHVFNLLRFVHYDKALRKGVPPCMRVPTIV